jgi:branched-chain amino acid transport system permease protein
MKTTTAVNVSPPIARTNAGGFVALISRNRVLSSATVLAVLPLLLPYPALAINVLIYGLFSTGYNLVFGYTGLLSLGHAALFGTGAYGCGIAIAVLGLPWYLSIIIGVMFAIAAAAIIGGLAIRTRGVYFGMVTLALAQCLYFIFYQWVSVTGGESGLPRCLGAADRHRSDSSGSARPLSKVLLPAAVRGCGAGGFFTYPPVPVRGRHRGNPRE